MKKCINFKTNYRVWYTNIDHDLTVFSVLLLIFYLNKYISFKASNKLTE